jgi:hypothetical protein
MTTQTTTPTLTTRRTPHDVSVAIRYLARGSMRPRTHRYTFSAMWLSEALDRIGRLTWELNDHGHAVDGVTVHGLEKFAF